MSTAATPTPGLAARRLRRAALWAAAILLSLIAVTAAGHPPELTATPSGATSAVTSAVAPALDPPVVDLKLAATGAGCVLVAVCCLLGLAWLRAQRRLAAARSVAARPGARAPGAIVALLTAGSVLEAPSLVALSISRT